MSATFETIQSVIANRRTVKPGLMNGRKIEHETVAQLLALADWAPTHGRTEPWRFFVYEGSRVQDFCRDHAELYRSNVPEESFNPESYNNLMHMGDKASHVMIAVMQRGALPKIPELEEIAAASAAIQNMLLGAAASGIAAYWGSGGMVYKPAMKTYLGLKDADIVLGAIYLGYTDEAPKPGVRNTPLTEKISWM
jgi:nitroreductase